MSSLNKVHPHSTDAEMAVLGAMLISKDVIENVTEILKSEYFYIEGHKNIYLAMLQLLENRKSVDLITVSEELKKTGRLEEIGGQKYLSDLIEKVSTPAHTQNYAKIVREKYILRELINSSTRVIENAYDGAREIDHILDQAQKDIFEISQKNSDHGFVSPNQLSKEYIDRVSVLYTNKNAITGIPTGFRNFDDKTGGLQNSEMIILAARPSQGKTAMALNIAYYVGIEKKIPVAFFSLEMNKMLLIDRLIGSAINLNISQIKRGQFPREAWAGITGEASKFAEANIWIDDTPGMNIMDIRARTRKLMLELKAKDKNFNKMLVIIDYLQLIRGVGRHENRQQEVSEISKLLKDMARSLNVPVIALSQLNRRTEDKSREGNRPQLSDLRESGSLEQDSDVVAMIHRDYYYSKDDSKKNEATLIVAKNRNGAVGDVDLYFYPELTKFANPPIPGSIPVLEDEVPL